MLAELIEALVVILLFDMSQLVRDDHLEKGRVGLLKQGGDADLVLGLELVALYPADVGMQAEGILDDVDLAVKHHL